MISKVASIAGHILAAPERMATRPFPIVVVTLVRRLRRTAP